jgi:hypothetical protein
VSLTRDQLSTLITTLTEQQAQGALCFLLGSVGAAEVQAAVDYELRVNGNPFRPYQRRDWVAEAESRGVQFEPDGPTEAASLDDPGPHQGCPW